VRRLDVADEHSRSAELLPERGEASGRGRLRRGVGRHARHGCGRHHARDVDEEAPALPQRRHHALRQPQRTHRIGEEQFLDHRVLGVRELPEGDDARGDHDAVETAVGPGDVLDEGGTGVGVRQVQGDVDGARASRDHHRGAVGGEGGGEGAAEAARSDDGDDGAVQGACHVVDVTRPGWWALGRCGRYCSA